MSGFVKNKFFMIMVVLMLFFTIVPSVLTATGSGNYVKNALNVAVSPLQKLFNYATDAMEGFTSYFTEFDKIIDENNSLKEENRQLKEQIADVEKTEQMNEWLYSYLELKREHMDFTYTSASVIGREAGNYMTVFTLDKGTLHGISAGMPAVTDYGVVGYVSDVGTDWCKVVTLLESGSAVGAYIERTEETGVVKGDFALSSEGLCLMYYIGADSTVTEGDRIFTSGYGSVYPRGLLIGYVEKTEPDPNTQTLTAYIRPSEQMTDITKLMIITSDGVTQDE